MFKFNDKLILLIDGEQLLVSVDEQPKRGRKDQIKVSSVVGDSFWADVSALYSLEEFKEKTEFVNSLSFGSPQDFADKLATMEDPISIKLFTEKLLKLPMFANCEASTIMGKLAAYNKAVKSLSVELVEGKNAIIQIKDDGSQWMRHLYFKFAGIVDYDWASANKKAKNKAIDRLRNQALELDAEQFEATVRKLFESDCPYHFMVGALAIIGRRPVEICFADFKISGDLILFDGQAKKRDEIVPPFEIPLLAGVSPKNFIAKIKKWRKHPKIAFYLARALSSGQPLKEAVDPIALQCRRIAITPNFDWMPRREGESGPTCKTMRAAWARIAASKYCPDGYSDLLWASEKLGHFDGDPRALLTSLGYFDFVLKEKQCSEPSNCFQELADSDLVLSRSVDSNLPEHPLAIMEPLVSPPKQSPSPSESSILPVDGIGNDLLSEKSENLVEQPQPAQLEPENLAESAIQIKAISLHQPWASLIASKHKHYETRSWPTNYRGLIAIHAAKKMHEDSRLLALFGKDKSEVPLGAVVAIAELTDCIKMDTDFIAAQSETEKMCGDWSVGRFAWKLENICAINPIAQRGYQGLWDWEIPVTPTVDTDSTIPEILEIPEKPPIAHIAHTMEKCPRDFVDATAPEKNIELTVGKSGSPVNGRNHLDFYETPEWMTLLALANVPLSGVIGEVCAGHNAIASILRMAGHQVWTNDIDTAKSADHHIDATDISQWINLPAVDWIVTNPPYAEKAALIVQNAYAYAKRGIVMILRQNWMEVCEDRREFLQLHPPTMLISVPRFCFRKSSKNNSWSTDQCPTWIYVWDKKITNGMTKIIPLGDKDIPLFHRTPDTAPSMREIKVEVAKYRIEPRSGVCDDSMVLLSAEKFAKISQFLSVNQLLPIVDRWLISGPVVALVCGCSSKLASDWVRDNREQIDLLNKGLGTYHNRGRNFKRWLKDNGGKT